MAYILKRLGYYLLAFWASITLNFLLPRLMPGDPFSRMFAPPWTTRSCRASS